MRHVLEAQQFSVEEVELLFNRAAELQKLFSDNRRHQKIGSLLAGHIMFAVFYEASTRTRISFSAAAQHMGMQVVSTENAAESSSATKGESLEDTIRVLCEYHPSLIVLRHPEIDSAKKAATVSTVPIINAGDGGSQHPSQALLDLYTIQRELGRKDNLHIVIGGDLLHSRTSRSLIYMLAKYPKNQFSFVSAPEFRLGDDVISYLKSNGIQFCETGGLEDSLKQADVVYWPRMQKERITKSSSKTQFVIGIEQMKLLKSDAILMSPLPRVDEIPTSVDKDPRAVYFREAGNGMFVRMALIEWVLKLI